MKGRSVTFRCLFVEQDPTAYAQLKKYCDSVSDIEVKTLPGDFVAHIPEILRFVAARRDSFPFFFIDPTGWLPLKILPLKPLLQYQPGEVLINFMTSYIRRFLEEQGEDFGAILGERAMANIHGLVGQERDDAAAFAYADQIAQAGNFPYVCTTLVLNPQINQTYYHLIYATRHHKGVEVFKDAERNASEFIRPSLENRLSIPVGVGKRPAQVDQTRMARQDQRAWDEAESARTQVPIRTFSSLDCVRFNPGSHTMEEPGPLALASVSQPHWRSNGAITWQ